MKLQCVRKEVLEFFAVIRRRLWNESTLDKTTHKSKRTVGWVRLVRWLVLMIMIIILRQHNLYVVKLNDDDGGGDTAEAGKFLLRTILWQTIEHEIGEINKL